MVAEGRFARLVALRPGEGRTVGLAVTASFFASAGLMIGQSGIEALFFARYGVSKLPVMYLVLGGTMFLLTIGFSALLGRLGRGRACLVVPAVLAVAATAGRLALAADVAWITQALWLLQGAAQFLVGLAVWGLAGLVTDTRQAKRFFPLIGAGSVLGYVLGGLVTKPLASAIGSPNLLLVWVATLVAVVVVGARLVAIGGEGPRSNRSNRVGPVEQLMTGLRFARRSTLMRWLALGSILFSLLFFSLYLPFSRAATARYPDPDQLAGFFGVFFGLSTAVAFLLSLFVTNRLLARLGVPTALLVLPLLYVVTFGVLTVNASFALLAVFRFAQVAWMSGGANSAWEAVINTVPTERRDQTRAFLYGGPTQVGTVLAGVIALVGNSLSASVLYGVGFACAVLATIAMIGVRRAYPRELVLALREGRPHVFDAAPDGAEPFGLARADRSTLEAAEAALVDPDPHVRRVATHVLGDLDPADTESSLLACLDDADPEVRATAVHALATATGRSVRSAVARKADDPDAAVRLAVVEAIARPAEGALDAAVVRLAADADPKVRARAAAALVAAGSDPSVDGATILTELARSDDPDARTAAFEGMRGTNAPALADLARTGLDDAAPEVRAAAAEALATLDPAGAVAPLAESLADDHPSVRSAAARSLATIGEPAMDAVIDSLGSDRRRDGALSALEHLPTEGHAGPIHDFATNMVAEAVEDHRLGAGLAGGSDAALALVRDSLFARSEREAALGLRAAAILGSRAALSVALENLSVTDPGQRANALEVIESVGAHDVVKPLLAIWDRPPQPIDPEALFEHLRTDPDPWIRACIDLATHRVPDHPAGGTMTKTLPTLAPMERVLFLRDVPLFSALPPSDLEPIAAIADEHAYADGDTIAEQGETGDAMHIIVSGDVAVVVHDEGASEHEVAVRSRGEVVGEMAVITHEPRVATLRARGDVRVLSIARPQFEAILRERPETAIGVIRVLSSRLATASA